MANLKGFKGLRYNDEKISKISDVIAPPYDVINKKQQEELLNQSQHNVVHIDFNDGIGDEKYLNAGKIFKEWLNENILLQEDKEAIYPYLQEFTYKSKSYTRLGFIALVEVSEFSKKIVLPHEQTFSGPKEDRYKLMKACKANLSPIFGVYDNSDEIADNILKNFIDQNSPVIKAESKDGVTNTVWKIDDEKKINQIIESFKPKEILIADGHHRYETSLNYYKDFPDDKNKYTMFYLAGSNQEGLLINPTHRILQDVKQSNLLIDQIKKDFDCENYNEEINENFLNPDEFFVISKEANIILRCKIKEENRNKFYSMSVYGVQEFIIDKFKDNYNGLDFFKSFNDANDSILENSLGLILPKFVPPDIMKVVLNDDKMPQKSTYFYPKVATGVLFNKLS
jgi:uncharacterized protein (DUF1015 family)